MHNPTEQLHAIWSDPINIFFVCNTDRSCLIQGFVSSWMLRGHYWNLSKSFLTSNGRGTVCGIWPWLSSVIEGWTPNIDRMQCLSSQYSLSLMILSFNFMTGTRKKKRSAPRHPMWLRRSLKCHWRTLAMSLRHISALKVRSYTCYFKHCPANIFSSAWWWRRWSSRASEGSDWENCCFSWWPCAQDVICLCPANQPWIMHQICYIWVSFFSENYLQTWSFISFQTEQFGTFKRGMLEAGFTIGWR